MSRKNKFAGYAMHEFYMPTTGKGQKNRRDRRKCEFYNLEHKMCTKLFKPCVGPSICDKYVEIESSPKTMVGTRMRTTSAVIEPRLSFLRFFHRRKARKAISSPKWRFAQSSISIFVKFDPLLFAHFGLTKIESFDIIGISFYI